LFGGDGAGTLWIFRERRQAGASADFPHGLEEAAVEPVALNAASEKKGVE